MRLTMAALRLLILILILYGCITLRSVGLSLREARHQLEEQQAAAQCLREENEQLRRRLSDSSQSEKWEYLARQQLGLVDPDDTVIYNVRE